MVEKSVFAAIACNSRCLFFFLVIARVIAVVLATLRGPSRVRQTTVGRDLSSYSAAVVPRARPITSYTNSILLSYHVCVMLLSPGQRSCAFVHRARDLCKLRTHAFSGCSSFVSRTVTKHLQRTNLAGNISTPGAYVYKRVLRLMLLHHQDVGVQTCTPVPQVAYWPIIQHVFNTHARA